MRAAPGLAPRAVVRAERVMLALGLAGQRGGPFRLHAVATLRRAGLVDRGPPDTRDLFHIGRAALPTFDLDRLHAQLDQFGQDRKRVQAGWLLECVVTFALNHEAALAQGRVAAWLVGRVAVDQHAVQASLHARSAVLPAHSRGWRADSGIVGRLPGRIGRQSTAALHHHTKAAEAEHLDIDFGVSNHLTDLLHGQNTGQDRTLDAVTATVELDRRMTRGRG